LASAPVKEAPGTHQIGGWTGARAGLGNLEERKKSLAPVGNKAQYLPIRTQFVVPNDLFPLLLPS